MTKPISGHHLFVQLGIGAMALLAASLDIGVSLAAGAKPALEKSLFASLRFTCSYGGLRMLAVAADCPAAVVQEAADADPVPGLLNRGEIASLRLALNTKCL